MRTHEMWMGSYVLNAIWQVPLIYVTALCMCRMSKRFGAAVQHRIWVGALIASAMLPALSFSAEDVRGCIRWLLQGARPDAGSHTPHVSVVQGATYAHTGLGIPVGLLE